MRDVEMGSDEKRDFISELPNEVLTFILSKLRVDEAVRCNILAKRWLVVDFSISKRACGLEKSILGLSF
ncbi:F-box protein at1g80960-like protein [Trifolium pratense]|uniref:F-box protein at1g80960-like protein n=1 Tax=Trifolium pratense TaxID=57577 RepID=A0A2K3LJ76_TRIPR|nr:F-box protein at1g80960-like protein [Trifolium pratense]